MHRVFFVLILLLGTGFAQTPIKFNELYSKITVRGAEFSPLLKKSKGQQVTMQGYMAPPLKPKLDFFVLTRMPMATCPFCTTAADWPADIVLVIMPKGHEMEPSTRVLKSPANWTLALLQTNRPDLSA